MSRTARAKQHYENHMKQHHWMRKALAPIVSGLKAFLAFVRSADGAVVIKTNGAIPKPA